MSESLPLYVHPGAIYTIEGHRKSRGTSYQTARTDLLGLCDDLQIFTKRKRGNAFVFVAPLSLEKAPLVNGD